MKNKKFKVLLVEDSHVDSYATQACLAENQAYIFDVEWAETYDTALNMALSGEYDFCLFDYRLGGRNGVDLAKTIDGLGVHSPVFLVSSTDLTQISGLDDAYNIKGYISKLGLSADNIIAELQHVLDGLRANEDEFVFTGDIAELRDPVVVFDADMKFAGSNKAFAGYGFTTAGQQGSLSAADIFGLQELSLLKGQDMPTNNIFITPLRIQGHIHHKIVWNIVPARVEGHEHICYVAKGVLQKVKWKKVKRKANFWHSLVSKIYANPQYVNINDNYYHRELFM